MTFQCLKHEFLNSAFVAVKAMKLLKITVQSEIDDS